MEYSSIEDQLQNMSRFPIGPREDLISGNRYVYFYTETNGLGDTTLSL